MDAGNFRPTPAIIEVTRQNELYGQVERDSFTLQWPVPPLMDKASMPHLLNSFAATRFGSVL